MGNLLACKTWQYAERCIANATQSTATRNRLQPPLEKNVRSYGVAWEFLCSQTTFGYTPAL